jgi:hypothetical protein
VIRSKGLGKGFEACCSLLTTSPFLALRIRDISFHFDSMTGRNAQSAPKQRFRYIHECPRVYTLMPFLWTVRSPRECHNTTTFSSHSIQVHELHEVGRPHRIASYFNRITAIVRIPTNLYFMFSYSRRYSTSSSSCRRLPMYSSSMKSNKQARTFHLCLLYMCLALHYWKESRIHPPVGNFILSRLAMHYLDLYIYLQITT